MIDYSLFKPYKSLLLAQYIDGVPQSSQIDALLDEIQTLFELSSASTRRFIEKKSEILDGVTSFGFMYYTVKTQATWTSDTKIVDFINHIFIVIQYKTFFAFYVSESQKRNLLIKSFNNTSSKVLGNLKTISPYILNTAFVNGDTRTLWLSATHRRTTIKPDSKILAGINLRNALDPLQDQSYYFTAARSYTFVGEQKIPVGCSPRGSSIWTGSSSSWADYCESVINLLKQVNNTSSPTESPLPIVASPVSKQFKELQAPFDIAFIPANYDDPDVNIDEKKEIELWTYSSSFKEIKLISLEDQTISAEIYLQNEKLGTLTFRLSVTDVGAVSWNVVGINESEFTIGEFNKALDHARNINWIKMWFDSGYTVSDGQIYEVRYRDFPFSNYHWVNFKNYPIKYTTKKEKPINPDNYQDDIAFIGADRTLHSRRKKGDSRPYTDLDIIPDDSLFGWVLRNWPNCDGDKKPRTGWLVCDDGSMEIADFIHLGEENGSKVLTLIHVKGGEATEISVSDYEVVASQAVKNLRSLDANILSKGLAKKLSDYDSEKKKVGNLIWKDGVQQPDRSEFINILLQLSSDYKRRVVILQPSLSKEQKEGAEKKAKNKSENENFARLRQLETLLLGVESDCRSLGAELWVISRSTDA